jgi:xylulokinase
MTPLPAKPRERTGLIERFLCRYPGCLESMPQTGEAALSSTCKYILAIDLGSGGPKVILFSERGELVASASRRTETILTPDGGGEQDPECWWQSITSAVQEILAARPAPIDDIAAIACTTQWSVTVPVDQHGRHLMNAIHWTDTRGAPYTRHATRGLIKVSGYGLWRLARWLRMTGGVPTHSGADALAHILFVKHKRPDVYHRTYKFLEPMEYLNFRLTGRCASSYGTIFPVLLTDNRNPCRVDYDATLIDWSGLDRGKLPDLLPVDTVLGAIRPEVAKLWGLRGDTQVVIGMCDSQAAVLGSGAVADYQGHFCIGTTAWMSCHVPFKKTNLANYLATMPAAVPGRYMVMAEQGAAGKCLETFVDRWLAADPHLPDGPQAAEVYKRLEELVGCVPPGSEGLLFLPWLNGAGPPSGDARVRGGFLNQSLRHGRAHATRAIMEGVAYNLRWLRDAVERFIGKRFESLNFIGGAARSAAWCQIAADVLQRPIHQMIDPHFAIARGAALGALLALGRLSLENIPTIVRVAETFEPRPPTRGVYDELFQAFLRSYRANRPIFRQLNRQA